MNPLLELYYAPNTIAAAPAIALYAANLDFKLKKIDFSKHEQGSAAYRALNPKARVPALGTDRGIITETGAILHYIAALAPQANLIPQDPFEGAQVASLLHYFASTMHVNHAHKLRGYRWATQESSYADMRAKVCETMTASCQFVERHINGPFIFGGQLTLADCHLYALYRWLEGDGVDVAAFPKLKAWAEHMQAQRCVQAVYAAGVLI